MVLKKDENDNQEHDKKKERINYVKKTYNKDKKEIYKQYVD